MRAFYKNGCLHYFYFIYLRRSKPACMTNFYFLLLLFLPFLSNAQPCLHKKSDLSKFVQGRQIKANQAYLWEFQPLTAVGGIRYASGDMLFYTRAQVYDKTTSNLLQAIVRTHDKTLGSGNTC
jgi:hypothetical protein